MNQFGLASSDIEKIRSIFRRHPKVKQVLIYGSRALGRERPGSDIDLVVSESPSILLEELLQIEIEIDDLLLPYKVDFTTRDRIENEKLLEHIDRVGKEFYRA